MFYLSYILAELRRRRGRTALTALGLGVGVALVVAVNALSSGLDHAQAQVLAPLTGVGTTMSVTRPLTLSTSGGNPFASLSPAERNQLRRENGGGRFGLQNLGKPGQHFSVDRFTTAGQLSLPAAAVAKVASLSGVAAAAGSLTVNDIHIAGTVPKTTGAQAGAQGGGFGGGFGGAGRPPGGGFGGPRSLGFNSLSITGVDPKHPNLAPVTPSQITRGHYFTVADASKSVILSSSYAASKNLSVDSPITIGGKSFHVIGLASAPLGGSPSDVYLNLATLQGMSSRSGRVTTVEVQAKNGGGIATVKREIVASISGAQVTTAQDLAKRVGGSLTDAKNLAATLGTALEGVGLLAALLIASLLTLASVSKRTREIGTLRAIGWSKTRVVRQVSLEVVAQGIVGGVLGLVFGVIVVAAINAVGWTLQASVAGPAQAGPRFGFGRFAQPASVPASTNVHVTASIDPALLAAAIGLALFGGLLAGMIGGLRAAQLRPAAALRTVE